MLLRLKINKIHSFIAISYYFVQDISQNSAWMSRLEQMDWPSPIRNFLFSCSIVLPLLKKVPLETPFIITFKTVLHSLLLWVSHELVLLTPVCSEQVSLELVSTNSWKTSEKWMDSHNRYDLLFGLLTYRLTYSYWLTSSLQLKWSSHKPLLTYNNSKEYLQTLLISWKFAILTHFGYAWGCLTTPTQKRTIKQIWLTRMHCKICLQI